MGNYTINVNRKKINFRTKKKLVKKASRSQPDFVPRTTGAKIIS